MLLANATRARGSGMSYQTEPVLKPTSIYDINPNCTKPSMERNRLKIAANKRRFKNHYIISYWVQNDHSLSGILLKTLKVYIVHAVDVN